MQKKENKKTKKQVKRKTVVKKTTGNSAVKSIRKKTKTVRIGIDLFDGLIVCGYLLIMTLIYEEHSVKKNLAG